LGCCVVGAFLQTPGNNRIDQFLCHNSGARPKQWWSPLTHSLEQVVCGGGCSLIQTKESFRAAYLGAGGSLAMVDSEREVGGSQEERGADAHGRGRGGSLRMMHRSKEGGGSPKQRCTSKQWWHLGESSTTSVQRERPSQQHNAKQQVRSGQQQKSNARQSNPGG
jgi:hypothetical protein